MLEELISKKELLEVTGISYGQLYRWKRKDLIKSVSTGQETFFPREKIIERINKIIELKDEASLDDLAYMFSNNIKEIKITRDYLISVLSNDIILRYEEIIEIRDIYEENNIFSLFIYNKLINLGSLSISELKEITVLANRDYEKIGNRDYELVIKRKYGVCYYYIILDNIDMFNDESSIELARININKVIEEIKSL